RHRLAAKFRAIAEDIPLTLLCFWFGPLVYAASLGTVAAMLLLAACTLVASRPDGLPIIAKSIRALSAAVPLLAWMLASAAWSPDSEAAADLTLRMAVLFSGGTLLVASFALLPLQRLRPPLIATALGLSAAGAIIAVDLASGGHLARFFRGPRLEGLDPALAYGRAATLHAILFAPILVGVLRLGRPWLAVGFALIAAIVILETWRPRLTQAMIAGSVAAAVSVGLVSFGIWQEWFVSGLFIVAAFVVLAARQSAAAPSGCTIFSKAGFSKAGFSKAGLSKAGVMRA
ncbi:MAG: hypothetical protein JOZ11_11245, partial [Alphaproteobacteria bacterium]|nr:hypothetical protein [Alphaproteobacteria bacterium]